MCCGGAAYRHTPPYDIHTWAGFNPPALLLATKDRLDACKYNNIMTKVVTFIGKK